MKLGGDSGEELILTSVRWVAWHCMAGNFQGWKLSQIGHFEHIHILILRIVQESEATHINEPCVCIRMRTCTLNIFDGAIYFSKAISISISLSASVHIHKPGQTVVWLCVFLSVCLSISCRYICSPGELQVLSICFYVLNIIHTFLYLNLADFWDKAWLWNYSENSLPRSLEGF